MVKEGSTKAGCVEKNIGCVVNFAPFCFADTIHFLMFWSCSFKFHSKVFAFGDEVCRCECGSCISSDESDEVGSATEFGLSEPGFQGIRNGECAFGWEADPSCEFSRGGDNEEIG